MYYDIFRNAEISIFSKHNVFQKKRKNLLESSGIFFCLGDGEMESSIFIY
jgi:hypothetical protein